MIIDVVEQELVISSEGLDEFRILVRLQKKLGSGVLDNLQRCLSIKPKDFEVPPCEKCNSTSKLLSDAGFDSDDSVDLVRLGQALNHSENVKDVSGIIRAIKCYEESIAIVEAEDNQKAADLSGNDKTVKVQFKV